MDCWRGTWTAKALVQGHVEIEAVQFEEDPEPDHVGLGPNDLPY